MVPRLLCSTWSWPFGPKKSSWSHIPVSVYTLCLRMYLHFGNSLYFYVLYRLIQKTEEAVEKDLLIQEKEKLYVELKNILARQPGPEIVEELSRMQYVDVGYAAPP
jgi:hypothetical protein